MKKAFLAVLLLFLLTGCREEKPKLYRRTGFYLGTYVTVSFYSHKKAEPLLEKVFSEIKRISDKYSAEDPSSYINRLCRKAQESYTELDEETLFLLKNSLRISRITSGAFDITLAPLKKLWGFNDHPRLPSREEINKVLRKTGWKKVHLRGKSLKLEPGCSFDLSGIAKGYAVDRAVKILRTAGIKSALVDAGGDIYALGRKPDGSKWRIGVKHPRKEGLIAVVELANSAIATSGDYENFFIKEGKRYHHIFNPSTGYPASLCQSVTVVAPTTLEADALSTALFVLGPEKGKEVARNLGLSVLIVDSRGQVHPFEFSEVHFKIIGGGKQ